MRYTRIARKVIIILTPRRRGKQGVVYPSIPYGYNWYGANRWLYISIVILEYGRSCPISSNLVVYRPLFPLFLFTEVCTPEEHSSSAPIYSQSVRANMANEKSLRESLLAASPFLIKVVEIVSIYKSNTTDEVVYCNIYLKTIKFKFVLTLIYSKYNTHITILIGTVINLYNNSYDYVKRVRLSQY